jgi:hypothetical protein
MSAEQRYEYLKSMETKAIARSESRQPSIDMITLTIT